MKYLKYLPLLILYLLCCCSCDSGCRGQYCYSYAASRAVHPEIEDARRLGDSLVSLGWQSCGQVEKAYGYFTGKKLSSIAISSSRPPGESILYIKQPGGDRHYLFLLRVMDGDFNSIIFYTLETSWGIYDLKLIVAEFENGKWYLSGGIYAGSEILKCFKVLQHTTR